MKGRDLLQVARDLARGKPPREPYARSAVSRAYYAAFSELGEYLRARSYAQPAGRSTHDAAWKHLKGRIPDNDLNRRARREAIADLGFQLKERRHKADYRLQSSLARDEPSKALEEAERIVTELDALDARQP